MHLYILSIMHLWVLFKTMENELCVGKSSTCLGVGHTFQIVFSGFSCHRQFSQKHCGAAWSPDRAGCVEISPAAQLSKYFSPFLLKVRFTTPGRVLIDGAHPQLEMAVEMTSLVCSEE